MLAARGSGTDQDLVQKVLDELLLKRTTRQEPMQVGPEELGDEVDVLEGRDEDVGERDDVFVLDVFEEFEFAVGTLGEDRSACEWRERGV